MLRRAVVALLILATLLLAGVGAWALWPSPSFVPDVVPVHAAGDLPAPPADRFAELAATDPVAMFDACLSKYQREVKGFSAVLVKRERVGGKLHPPEKVRLAVWGDVPGPDEKTATHVRMIWDEGAKGDGLGILEKKVQGVLYVEPAAATKMTLYRPGALLNLPVGIKDAKARESSRYCVTDAGLYRGMLRTYAAWKARKEAGELVTEYVGKRAVAEVGGRECYVVKRACKTAEVDSFALDEKADPKQLAQDGFTEVTVMIDAERWLQVGTVIRRADGELVGEYYFRDVELRTEPFPPDTFKPEALRK